MPLLNAELLQQLCVEGANRGEKALCFGRCYLPLWLRLDETSQSYLRQFIAGEKDASVGALVKELGGQLEMPPGDWHRNVNHPQDFKHIYHSAAGACL